MWRCVTKRVQGTQRPTRQHAAQCLWDGGVSQHSRQPMAAHGLPAEWMRAAHAAGTEAAQALRAAEAAMTVCEVATHRIFVALLHSRMLLRRPALRQQWLEALDGLGGFVDLIPGRGPGAQHSGPGRRGFHDDDRQRPRPLTQTRLH